MKKKTILLDVDDVVCDTTEEVLKLYNKEYGTNVVLSDIINYGFENCPKIKHDAIKYFRNESFFKNLTPNLEAVSGVRYLQDNGFDVMFATATQRLAYNIRHDWLLEYFSVPEENIILCTRKDVLVADWFFDDKLDNLFSNKSKHVICRNRPWNSVENHPDANHLKRVSDFMEFVELVFKTEKEMSLGKLDRIKKILTFNNDSLNTNEIKNAC